MTWNGVFIAECGSNHEGELDRAKQLVHLAWESGAHVCKFQLWTDPEITARGNVPLPFEHFQELWRYAEDLGIELTASAFDEISLDFLLGFHPKYVKFAYSKRHWKAGIEKAFTKGAMPIVSTSLLDAPNITKEAIKLFCIPEYPVLHAVDFQNLSESPAWKLIHGFSDHTCGISQTISASMWPRVHFIEKHIRLETGSVPDHWFSIGEKELKNLLGWWGIERRGEKKAG